MIVVLREEGVSVYDLYRQLFLQGVFIFRSFFFVRVVG